MRSVLNVEDRRTKPKTSYPLSNKNSARYEPSCPVIPVMSAFFIAESHYREPTGITREQALDLPIRHNGTAKTRIGEGFCPKMSRKGYASIPAPHF